MSEKWFKEKLKEFKNDPVFISEGISLDVEQYHYTGDPEYLISAADECLKLIEIIKSTVEKWR